jgi:hypothetical protein
MNFGKLLGAGKSFLGGKGAVKYRENRRVYLPKFNPAKNPFISAPASPQPDGNVENKKISALAVSSVPVKARTNPVVPAARPTRAASWKEKFNPFRASEPAAPAMTGAVQVELTLEAVKVIHNDLADAEIEVVPVKSQTISVPETPILPPARNSWEFLGERLVRAE